MDETSQRISITWFDGGKGAPSGLVKITKHVILKGGSGKLSL